MNNPLNKIEISKASLLGLKAELLKSKNDFEKLKLDLQKNPKPVKKDKKLKVVKEINETKQIDPEEIELLRKSKEILQKKTEIYNDLVKPGTSTENVNDIYLVQFAEKQNESLTENIIDDEPSGSDTEDHNSSEDEVEYVDYFGRTHTYPRKDLHMYINKDKRLSKMLQLFPSDKLVSDIDRLNLLNGKDKTAENNSDVKLDQLHKEWEKQEEILKSKNVIHYQDILFNEARMHGVAYYRFSSDDAERAKQHKALEDLRQETLQEQKKRAEHRARRNHERKLRVLAAKNRVRARKGLPPLELVEEISEETVKVLTQEEQFAQQQKEREAIYEKKKEEMRHLKLRPWDDDTEEGIPVFNEMSQEQWVEKKRKERDEQFAPPSFYNDNKSKYTKQKRTFSEQPTSEANAYNDSQDLNTNVIEDKLRELRNKVEQPVEQDEEKFLHFTSKPVLKRKNISMFTPQPIVNEVSDNSSSEEVLEDTDRSHERQGIEIPPPATFEYYGPNTTKIKRPKVAASNIEESISAGLEFLKDKVKNRRKVNIDHLDM